MSGRTNEIVHISNTATAPGTSSADDLATSAANATARLSPLLGPSPTSFFPEFVSIYHFPRSTPSANKEDYYSYYQDVLTECIGEPDLMVRQVAVDVRRLDEPAIWYAVQAAEIIVAYDLFFDERFLIAGNRKWEQIMYGYVSELPPTRILSLCMYIERELSDAIMKIEKVRRGCSCQQCERFVFEKAGFDPQSGLS